MNADTLTQDQLKTLLHYDPDTGVFTWLPRDVSLSKNPPHTAAWNTSWAGQIAGTMSWHGYIHISLQGKKYKAHRLAYLWMTGKFPLDQTDHINGNRKDNCWANLREATKTENMRNLKLSIKNTSGVIGVSWYKREQKWCAVIGVEGRRKVLGYFDTFEDGVAVRAAAEQKHNYHPNHGKG
jgi:hypothetical protein